MAGHHWVGALAERTPLVTAPDGTPYKVPIADILRSKGVNI